MIRTIILCAAALWAASAQAQVKDTFPRTAGYLIGNPVDYQNPEYQQRIAKLDVAILGIWPGWERSRGTTLEQVARRIKTLNPSIKIFLYFCPESTLFPAQAYAELGAKLDQNRWWLYRTGTASSRVLSDFGRDTYVLNLTNFTPPDSSGKRLNEWLPEHVFELNHKNNPSIDGTFTDNVFWKPRRDGDWNRDGRIDDQDDPEVQEWYRQGYRTYLAALKKLMPDKMHIGNIADWGHRPSVLTEYDQLMPGGLMEAAIGTNYSTESFDGWDAMFAGYRKSMAALAQPKLGIFHQFGSPSDLQAFRYGFATSLLDDAYYAYSDLADGYSGVNWFDEFDVSLGRATSAPPREAWQKGVWRRDFEHGIALVNPKGNGPVEIALEGSYRKVAGKQDRAVNNGQVVGKVTLRDRDGIILLKMQRRPRAPGSVKATPIR